MVTVSPCAVYPGAVGMMMAVSFTRYGRLYYLDPGGTAPRSATRCWCPPTTGPEVAECVWAPPWVDEDDRRLPVCAGSRPTSTWPATSATSAPRRGPRSPSGWSREHDAADEGRRRRLPRRRPSVLHHLLHRPGAGRLPRARPRPCRAACAPGSSCARSAPVTRPACRAASAPAVATRAARRSSRTSSRSPSGWPRTRTCRPTR